MDSQSHICRLSPCRSKDRVGVWFCCLVHLNPDLYTPKYPCRTYIRNGPSGVDGGLVQVHDRGPRVVDAVATQLAGRGARASEDRRVGRASGTSRYLCILRRQADLQQHRSRAYSAKWPENARHTNFWAPGTRENQIPRLTVNAGIRTNDSYMYCYSRPLRMHALTESGYRTLSTSGRAPSCAERHESVATRATTSRSAPRGRIALIEPRIGVTQSSAASHQ